MDLIVIGAYSHARSIEVASGGVTRTLLKRAPIPVLMFTVTPIDRIELATAN